MQFIALCRKQFFHNVSILQSCPAINVFTAENLDRGLQAAAESFCSQEVCIDSNKVCKSIEVLFWEESLWGTHNGSCHIF